MTLFWQPEGMRRVGVAHLWHDHKYMGVWDGVAPEGVDKEDKREPLFPGVTLCSPVMADSSTPNLTLDHGAPRTGYLCPSPLQRARVSLYLNLILL